MFNVKAYSKDCKSPEIVAIGVADKEAQRFAAAHIATMTDGSHVFVVGDGVTDRKNTYFDKVGGQVYRKPSGCKRVQI